MICSSALSNVLKPLVPDTSVLINLHASSFGEEVLREIPNEIVLPDRVVRELEHETSHTNGENGFIQGLISEDVIKVFELEDAANDIFEELISGPGSLGDGEAASIAVAVTQGFVPVIDERKGRARAAKLMNNQAPAWSLDLLMHPAVQEGLPDGGFIQAIYLALREGRMRIDENRCEAVVKLIGVERAIHCTSLPGFKTRRRGWQR